ncbi:Uncharacterised protein [Vibrio cholerae]|nr:Uncharacterised protein [Vibrio cholerae]
MQLLVEFDWREGSDPILTLTMGSIVLRLASNAAHDRSKRCVSI